jgi:hypothetical protein
MKKLLYFALCAVIVFSLSSCKAKSTPIDPYTDGYNNGYTTGYDEAWDSCEEEISNNVSYSFWKMKHEVCNQGWHPEEALEVLDSYLYNKPFYEDGSCATKSDVESAINVISSYYYGTIDCLNDTLDIDVY